MYKGFNDRIANAFGGTFAVFSTTHNPTKKAKEPPKKPSVLCLRAFFCPGG
jgi:hypothetical protein